MPRNIKTIFPCKHISVYNHPLRARTKLGGFLFQAIGYHNYYYKYTYLILS